MKRNLIATAILATNSDFIKSVKKGVMVVVNEGSLKEPLYYVGKVAKKTRDGNVEVEFADGDFGVYRPTRSLVGLVGIASKEIQSKGLVAAYKRPVPNAKINKYLETPIGAAKPSRTVKDNTVVEPTTKASDTEFVPNLNWNNAKWERSPTAKQLPDKNLKPAENKKLINSAISQATWYSVPRGIPKAANIKTVRQALLFDASGNNIAVLDLNALKLNTDTFGKRSRLKFHDMSDPSSSEFEVPNKFYDLGSIEREAVYELATKGSSYMFKQKLSDGSLSPLDIVLAFLKNNNVSVSLKDGKHNGYDISVLTTTKPDRLKLLKLISVVYDVTDALKELRG